MEHYERIAAAQGVFNGRALHRIRQAYNDVVEALDPHKTLNEAERAEIADAVFFLARVHPSLSASELTLRIVKTFSSST